MIPAGSGPGARHILPNPPRGKKTNCYILFPVLYEIATIAVPPPLILTVDRCLQTALPVANVLNLPIHVEHGEFATARTSPQLLTATLSGLSEWYSPVAPGTGLHPRPLAAADLNRYFTEIDPSWSSVWYPSRKGEDVKEVHARVNGFLDLFVPEVETRFADQHENILLVSHAATTIALCRGLLALPDMPLRVGCCSVSEFSRKPATHGIVGAWDTEKLVDGSHLKDGASRDWGFEDIEMANGKVCHPKTKLKSSS